MIQVIEWNFEVIFCALTSRKYDFFQVDKATIQVVEWHLNVIFLPLDKPKIRHLVRSRKRCFKWSRGPKNSFSSS